MIQKHNRLYMMGGGEKGEGGKGGRGEGGKGSLHIVVETLTQQAVVS